MANDCLVTKLKGVVNNNSLLKLGDIVVKITDNSATNMLMGSGVKVSVKGSGTITWNGNTYTELQAPTDFDGNWNPVLSVGEYVINVPYTTDVFVLLGYAAPGNNDKKPIIDPDFLKYRNILSMNIGGNYLTKNFNVSDLYSLEKYTNLTLANCEGFYGDIAAFGNSPLSVLNVANTNITGEINDMLALRTSAGYTGDIAINAEGTDVTFNGNTAGNHTYTYNGSSWQIAF